jgi:xylan 1,4-beta-xylosidase
MQVYGVPKPAYRAFELLHKSGPLRAPVTGNTATNLTVLPLLTEAKDTITVLLALHGTPSLQPPDNITVDLVLSGVAVAKAENVVNSAVVGRLNATSGNPKAAWTDLGSPDYPSPAEVEKMMAASQPFVGPVTVRIEAKAVGDDAEEGVLTVRGVSVEAYSLVWVRISGVEIRG